MLRYFGLKNNFVSEVSLMPSSWRQWIFKKYFTKCLQIYWTHKFGTYWRIRLLLCISLERLISYCSTSRKRLWYNTSPINLLRLDIRWKIKILHITVQLWKFDRLTALALTWLVLVDLCTTWCRVQILE